jgi:hypothetical protein
MFLGLFNSRFRDPFNDGRFGHARGRVSQYEIQIPLSKLVYLPYHRRLVGLGSSGSAVFMNVVFLNGPPLALLVLVASCTPHG